MFIRAFFFSAANIAPVEIELVLTESHTSYDQLRDFIASSFDKIDNPIIPCGKKKIHITFFSPLQRRIWDKIILVF